MKTYALSLAIAAVLCATTARADDRLNPAHDIVGTILAVEGLATVSSPTSSATTATVNMPVHPHDVIATGPRARVFVQLLDNSELTIGENGQMSVDDYAFDDKDNADNRATYSFLKGAFLYVSGLMTQKDNPQVTVETAYGSIGIRGTKFWGGTVNNEYGVIVGEGTIVIDTGAGHLTLERGQATRLKGKGQTPGAVETWSKDKIELATTQIKLKAPEVIGQRMQENVQRNQLLRAQERDVLQFRKKVKNGDSFTKQEEKPAASTERKIEIKRPAATTGDTTVNTKNMTTNTVTEKLGNTLSKTIDGSDAPTTIIHATPLRGSNANDAAADAISNTSSAVTQDTSNVKSTATDAAVPAGDAAKTTADRVENTTTTTTTTTTNARQIPGTVNKTTEPVRESGDRATIAPKKEPE